MGTRYFSIDEVNQLIPQLEHHFRRLVFHKKEMAKSAVRLRKLGVEPQLLSEPAQPLNSETEPLHHEINSHYVSFKRHLAAIGAMGGEIKDLELGRVDFPSLENGVETCLTWALGVTEAAYRHSKAETGFASTDLKPVRRVG